MWTPGPLELIVILAVILIFGARRLPDIGSGLGKGIKNFRKAFKEIDEIDVTPEPGKIEGGKAQGASGAAGSNASSSTSSEAKPSS